MYKIDQSNLDIFAVAPRAGAGIEILLALMLLASVHVAPRAGARIEMARPVTDTLSASVAPPRGGEN